MPAPEPQNLADAHRRFARAVLGIYVASALVTLALVLTTVVTDRAHEEEQRREQLLLEAVEQEHHLSRHLARLVQELRRLGLRSEVDLLDENLAPEKSLLRLSHEGSTFFNLGVALLATDGRVLWAEPQEFLGPVTTFTAEPWFAAIRKSRTLRIVPVDPAAENAALYVVSPVVRNGRFAGALLGAIDLAREPDVDLAPDPPGFTEDTLITTSRGVVVYPAVPPPFTADPRWPEVFAEGVTAPRLTTTDLLGRSTVLAVSPIARTDLVYVLAADRERLSRKARERMVRRLAGGVALTLVPLAILVLLLTRSLRLLRASEERLVRDERLRLAGEAANLIAHEVKNGLNGIQMAAEIAFEPSSSPARRERAATELRRELQRLTSFTTELMTFSKGLALRPIRVNLSELTSSVTAAAAELSAESGVLLRVSVPDEPVHVHADPTLLHVVLGNLLNNAVEACATAAGKVGEVEVRLAAGPPDEAGESRVTLTVADNGPGVPDAMKPRLFVPFESGKPNGVGIGLALSKRIAVAHGGDLVLSPSERGALFTLTLPREKTR